MKTKPNSAKAFWEKADQLLAATPTPLTKICKDQEINYDTLISSKIRVAYPSLVNTYRLAKALEVPVEYFLSDDTGMIVAESYPEYSTKDPLYKILEEEHDLKTLVWRIAQCSAIQLRTIKTMLASWGIGEYDAMGNSKAVASS